MIILSTHKINDKKAYTSESAKSIAQKDKICIIGYDGKSISDFAFMNKLMKYSNKKNEIKKVFILKKIKYYLKKIYFFWEVINSKNIKLKYFLQHFI